MESPFVRPSRPSSHLHLVHCGVEEADAAPSSGFVAYLQNERLPNLLLLECRARSTGVYGVLSEDRVGYVHLAQGELIHVETESTEGELALVEILGWPSGRFQKFPIALHPDRTVDRSLQRLLLESVQSQNDLREDSSPPSGGGEPTDVLVSPDGLLKSGRGPETETLAAQASFLVRLGDLIGQAIGSGKPRQVELTGSGTRAVVFRVSDGHLAASRSGYDEPLGAASGGL